MRVFDARVLSLMKDGARAFCLSAVSAIVAAMNDIALLPISAADTPPASPLADALLKLNNEHAAHKPPIAVNLPILPHRRVAQIHAPSESDSPPSENTLGWHYIPKSALEAD